MEVIDSSINKEAALAEEFPTAVDSEEIVSELFVHPNEVQDQLPSESTSQVEAEGDPHNTIVSEMPVVPSLPLQFCEGIFSATPVEIEGSTHNVDSPAIPQTPDDTSFDLALLPALLK
ncbi:hypothetical protein MRB53_002419 [Persea americana]|uniref:Uncharacterized protein n=1 Tax=Persea americana TaxID=3435 RepID=A0ACC2MUN9_PERAE|nr:hypothetical protein MRB53_002419 [Persea americana]